MEYITHDQALQSMKDGKNVKNILFSDEEYLFFMQGNIMDEKEYYMGNPREEFWSITMKKLPNKWFVDNK